MFSAKPPATRVATFSKGMHEMRGPICEVLGCDDVALSPKKNSGFQAVVGWGAKDSVQRGHNFAQEHGLPLLRLEDGFLRSIGTERGKRPLSLVVDDRGIYYDISQESLLESLLVNTPFDTGLTDRARQAIEYMLAIDASKYSMISDKWDLPAKRGKRRILVLGQVDDDLSLVFGASRAVTNLEAVQTAADENPYAEIWYKPHPDILSGYKETRVTRERIERFAQIVPPGVSLPEAFRHVDHVYTITSLGGFEALLRGLPVTTLGCPFYSGWGLTDDRDPVERRQTRRTLEEVFAASYILYPIYLDPHTGKRCRLETVLDYLEASLRRQREHRQHTVCLGITGWKRQTVTSFLNGSRETKIEYMPLEGAADAVRAAEMSGGRILQWASKEVPGLEELCAHKNVPLVRMEDGFLRSAGLGVALTQPGSLVMDHAGIHYDPSRPSDIETILQNGAIPGWALKRARALRERLVDRGIGKYGLSANRDDPWPERDGRPRILVIGQVEDDASVKRGTFSVRTNAQLLEKVAATRQEALIAYKAHPDVVAGLRKGAVPERVRRILSNFNFADVGTAAAIAGADEVHVMTSGAGLEALMAGREVFCHGVPFYAGWGLTKDAFAVKRRTRRRTLDEVVAAAFILYPSYLCPVTQLPCGPERILELIADNAAWPRPSFEKRLAVGAKRAWRKLKQGVSS